MKLSEIRGEKALDVMADAMDLAESLSDDESFKALVELIKGREGEGVPRGALSIIAKLVRAHKKEIVALMASAKGVTYEEYAEGGEVVADVVELLGSDASVFGFLSQQR